MSATDEAILTIKLQGSRIDKPELPLPLRSATLRAAGPVDDPFLKHDYLEVVEAYDLSTAARSAAGTQGEILCRVKPGQVLVLELPDGTTLITSGGRLEEALDQVAPDAVAQQVLVLDEVRPAGAVSRGLGTALGRWVSRLFVLGRDVPTDDLVEEALGDLAKRGDLLLVEKLRAGGLWGASYAATRALMWAVEKRLLGKPGLYRWADDRNKEPEYFAPDDPRLVAEAAQGQRLLVFIHGTASSTSGSFSDLRKAVRDAELDWDVIASRFGNRIFGLEHRTFSDSPIENALQLVEALPQDANVDLVTHSRGGIVGDLLAVDFNDAGIESLISGYRRFRNDAQRVLADFDEADEKDRTDLRRLARAMREKKLAIGRYVRVAAPVNGTLLAGANLDLFLSSLLALVGYVTTLRASPYYFALRRIVLDVARNRTDPRLVPGVEAMLPGSAISRFLCFAKPAETVKLGVIAGDIEGAHRLKSLVEFLTDWAIFERRDHDLVVDTASMYTGIARKDNARQRFVWGARVDHFHYFENQESRVAMTQWLTAAEVEEADEFSPLIPGAVPARTARGASDEVLPVVFVVPGIMGSHLRVGTNRVWLDPLEIAAKGLAGIAYPDALGHEVSAEALFDLMYGNLCRYLEQTHCVVPFAYDWRLAVEKSAEKLAAELDAALSRTDASGAPVRILAHSMGGLVARAVAEVRPDVWTRFMKRADSRLIMLGTPNQGSHQMVANLIGKGSPVRELAMLAVTQGLQSVLDLVAGFPGALQLLPRSDSSHGGRVVVTDYLDPSAWDALRPQVFDFWFGNSKVASLRKEACDEARKLWALPGFDHSCIPGDARENVIYVCGRAVNTPCGLRVVGGRIKLLGTSAGDGSVTWTSGDIAGIGKIYAMDVAHSDLASTREHFAALEDLLAQGETKRLTPGWPSAAPRGPGAEEFTVYDAGPAVVPDEDMLALGLLGATRPTHASPRAELKVLTLSCAAMELTFARDPILVGHYEQDPISGAEARIDQAVVSNELTVRNHLGLYPGPIGTALVVLMTPNREEALRQDVRGAVVTGLGEWGKLTVGLLTEAVRAAALRYLLSVVEREYGACFDGKKRKPIEVGLSSLLLGYSSTANIGVEDSVYAITRGVVEANRQFAEAQRGRQMARVVRLELIELYLDVAITATKALSAVASRIAAETHAQGGVRIMVEKRLQEGDGVLPRLEIQGQFGYWPRLSITAVGGEPGGQTSASAPAGAAERTRGRLAERLRNDTRTESTRGPIAERLRYVFLGQRARAESEVLQRQPELVETLVKLAIQQPKYNPELSRTLFNLMVPLEFKQMVRQIPQISLLLDDHTANMPWELLCADERPLINQTGIVRQLESPGYRQRVRSTVEKTALVVGNPSTKGFGAAFPGKGPNQNADLPTLPAAEAEAYAVRDVLTRAGYQTVPCIGEDQTAVNIISSLFQRAYRILHIAGHGEFEARAANGSTRSGVLLSDGLLLTAAEIHQMEVVPDLVFLNCCYLGTIDGNPISRDVPYNRLASSIARELIDMGVRAVVVAGWAVNDQAARSFAETFYVNLLDKALPFGLAVHDARRATYQGFPESNTWGAFQAYGDPGYVVDPSRDRQATYRHEPDFVAVEELLTQLRGLQQALQDISGTKRKRTLRSVESEVKGLLSRSPPSWLARGDVQFALGMVFGNLGQEGFLQAVEHLSRAVEADSNLGHAPLRALEQLGFFEAHVGESTSDAGRIRRGRLRLEKLVHAASADPARRVARANAERCGLLGSAWKREAALIASGLRAERALHQERTAEQEAAVGELKNALKKASDWYALGEGEFGKEGSFSPYCALNHLMLEALLHPTANFPRARAEALGAAGQARFKASRAYWDAIMPADARLATALGDGSLDDSAKCAQAIANVAECYEQVRRCLPESARHLDSVHGQIELLAQFSDALERKLAAESLQAIAQALKGAL